MQQKVDFILINPSCSCPNRLLQ